jgi:hypothetical protein
VVVAVSVVVMSVPVLVAVSVMSVPVLVDVAVISVPVLVDVSVISVPVLVAVAVISVPVLVDVSMVVVSVALVLVTLVVVPPLVDVPVPEGAAEPQAASASDRTNASTIKIVDRLFTEELLSKCSLPLEKRRSLLRAPAVQQACHLARIVRDIAGRFRFRLCCGLAAAGSQQMAASSDTADCHLQRTGDSNSVAG